MSGKASVRVGGGGKTHSKPRTLRAVVREQGRSYVWLARQTGYSADHIAGVAKRRRVGSAAFHIAMSGALGEEYAP